MSTVKTDAITAVSTNGDLSLDGLGTGGVSNASTLKMTKGGDIASASPLVIDTDGNYFDVTGTTNFAAMTVEEGNFFMLQFDGALTITHGSGIELPGAANLTTAAGDRLICYATAANTVEVMSVETEAAASTGLTVLAEVATTSGSSVALTTAIPSTATFVVINVIGVSGDSGSANPGIQLGDSGGLETSGYLTTFGRIVSTTPAIGDSTASFVLANHNATSDTTDGVYFLSLQDATNNVWCFQGLARGATTKIYYSMGSKALSAELDRITIITLNGDFDAGVASVSYM